MFKPKAVLFATGVLCLAAGVAQAGPLVVGSGNEAVIEPGVAHPAETPCVVPLVSGAVFAGFTPAPISFAPPAACPGPWAKVVLGIDIRVTKGRQFDRTGTLFLGGVPLWFGTTAEPRATLAPSWHFERDVTDETALFGAAQTGSMLIGNVVDSTYTGVITAGAALSFYPVSASAPAPVTADVVLPLSASGATVALNTASDQLVAAGDLPRNILKARLDLFLQGQSNDEFWYTCDPNDVAGELDDCGGGALREGEVSVDGTPAGVAPVFPWIFTGGIDPYLWQPIPGVQTFDFKPFPVDLSPFAGVLSKAGTHSIATSVYGANSYFSATGALLLFLDHGATRVRGDIIRNTLAAAPRVRVVNGLVPGNTITGDLDTFARHDFTISGSVTGSAGTTINTVQQSTLFRNLQSFAVSGTQDQQTIHQATDVSSVSTAKGGGVVTTVTKTIHWPLLVFYNYVVGKSGAARQVAHVTQQDTETDLAGSNIAAGSASTVSEGIETQDTLYYNADGAFIGHLAQAEVASYLASSTAGGCFKRGVSAVNSVITAVSSGC